MEKQYYITEKCLELMTIEASTSEELKKKVNDMINEDSRWRTISPISHFDGFTYDYKPCKICSQVLGLYETKKTEIEITYVNAGDFFNIHI